MLESDIQTGLRLLAVGPRGHMWLCVFDTELWLISPLVDTNDAWPRPDRHTMT